MLEVLILLLGYGCGCLPVASLVARRHGVDLRTTADGNPGAWNAMEQLGGRGSWPVFVGDALKALAPGLVGVALGGWWLGWVGVAGAMLGHAFPLQDRGRGGKAVMCFVGGAFALSPPAAAACLLLAGAAWWIRDRALGARLGVAGYPLVQLVTDPILHVAGTGALMTFVGLLFVVRRRPRVGEAQG